MRFSDNLVQEQQQQSESYDFNFGEPVKHKKCQSRNSRNSNNFKLKSALKSAPMKDQVIFSTASTSQTPRPSINSGAFDMSSAGSSNKAFFNEPSSLGLVDNANIYGDSDDGPIQPQNPYRNIGPTPQFLASVGPERFWLPPNAPITSEIPGPFLPYNQGIPGQIPFDSSLPVPDAYLPQVTGITGPRDPLITNDPITAEELARRTGPATIGSFVPEYRPPSELTPLNPVTPIPGGNIIDPLSPQVNNIRGPFFPDNPRNDGAYLITADVPPPQLVARDLEDGPYIVERVIDPIVFFDPVQNRTVVFDPLRNFTRLYNPQTDPELPIDDAETEPNPLNTANGQVQQPATTFSRLNGGNNDNLLKSFRNGGPEEIKSQKAPVQPAFWILKKLENDVVFPEDNLKSFEKSFNYQQNQNGNMNGASSTGSRVIFQSKPAPSMSQPQEKPVSLLKSSSKKKKPIVRVSHYKANLQEPQQNPPEQFRIQLASSNPNEESSENTTKSSKTTTEVSEGGNNNKVQVTLVYRPIVDIELGKRYNGFKANGNVHHKNSAFKLSPTILTGAFLVLGVATSFLI